MKQEDKIYIVEDVAKNLKEAIKYRRDNGDIVIKAKTIKPAGKMQNQYGIYKIWLKKK